jgi:hypothetical protein
MSSNLLTIAKIRTRDLLALLIFGCFLCMLGLAFLSVMPPKGAYLIKKMDSGVGLFLTGASLLLALLGLRFLNRRQAAHSDRIVLFSGFVVALVPAVCILWTFLSAWFAPLPCHVYESDTKHIAAGMTKAQVVQEIGSPRGSSWGDHKMRLTYDLQIAWGNSGRQFFVDLIDDKVVSARIVPYGGELDDDFWESDFLKDLKAGKALPSKVEVERACLTVCKKEVPGTVEVVVSAMDLCLLSPGRVQATGRVADRYAADGVSNGLSKPFTIVLAKGPAGWQPMEYDLMGAKGTVQPDAANGSQPIRSETNSTSSAAGSRR